MLTNGREKSTWRRVTPVKPGRRGSVRLEIIMPPFFGIILFFNAHILLLQFLRFAAIIPKLCSKNLIKNDLQQMENII